MNAAARTGALLEAACCRILTAAEKAELAYLVRGERPVVHGLEQAAEEACYGLNIEADELLAVLSADDVTDFAAGLLPFTALRALADVLAIRKMVDVGRVPAPFTATATCDWCGPVFVSPAFAGRELKSCPWCLNRHRHKPIPRPPPAVSSGKL